MEWWYSSVSEIVDNAANNMPFQYVTDHRGGVVEWKAHRIRNQETYVLLPCLTPDIV